jgi:hypothetical protein
MLLLCGIATREDPDSAIDIGQLEIHVLRLADDKGFLLDVLIVRPAEVGAPWGTSHIWGIEEGITLVNSQLTAIESDNTRSRYSAYHASWKWFVLSVAVRFGTILSVLPSLELLLTVSDDQSQVSSYSVLLECDLRTELTGSKAAEFHGAVTLVFLGLPSIFAACLRRSEESGQCS